MITSNRSSLAAALLVVLAALAPVPDVNAQSPLFEVEKNDSTKLLQLNDDGGFVLLGSLSGTVPVTGPGGRLMWHARKYALRAGYVTGAQWDDANIALGSVGLGRDTRATASLAVALGDATEASGFNAIAGGEKSVARGNNTLAVGEKVHASNTGSVALGVETVASGPFSFAMGKQTQALGNGSVALGHGVVAQGSGSFSFGDFNTSYHRPAQTNQFVVRAFGGILLNTGPFIGCELVSGSGTWSCASSRSVKEGFEPTDAEEILRKVAGLSIHRWRYIGSATEHIGPIAEDFRQAFGLGADSTKIDGVDADGIALRAIQALERRTIVLKEQMEAVQAKNAALEADNGAIRAEIAALRAQLAQLVRRDASSPSTLEAGR